MSGVHPFLALVALVLGGPQAGSGLVLELRVFNGQAEVSSTTRVTVHRAGDRGKPVAVIAGGQAGVELEVPEGIYDVQAIEERDGSVVNIQWANRLVVMPYPDEGGRHLEVLNFQAGFGALQVRGTPGGTPEVALQTGSKEAARAIQGQGYILFVVPAGTYDVLVRRGERSVRHSGIEVPRDRTRLWVVPADK
ncbi:MAG TPA: hypothetical protein VFO14_21330 [Vicinamibacterales bacterium]|jgi:hypothetical protein|nr:hypothetical protein [Vicinamibacterales bacterium]